MALPAAAATTLADISSHRAGTIIAVAINHQAVSHTRQLEHRGQSIISRAQLGMPDPACISCGSISSNHPVTLGNVIADDYLQPMVIDRQYQQRNGR